MEVEFCAQVNPVPDAVIYVLPIGRLRAPTTEKRKQSHVFADDAGGYALCSTCLRSN